MALTDHPVMEKIIAGVFAAGMVGIGSMAFNANNSATRSEVKVDQALEMRQDVRAIRESVVKVEKDVAVITARMERD